MVTKEVLSETLRRLNEAQFEEVVFRLESNYPLLSAYIPSRPAPLADRAEGLIRKLVELNGLKALGPVIIKVAPGFESRLS